MARPRVTFGYHVPGDYHSFINFTGIDRFLGATGDFRDPTALLGLTTALHEHAHLVQSRTTGYCLWLEDTKDDVADKVGHVIGAAGGIPDSPPWDRSGRLPSAPDLRNSPFSQAVLASHKRDKADHFLLSDSWTRQLYDAEAAETSLLPQVFPAEVRTLTTHDLLESQAAMVSQWQLQQLILSRPEHFDPRVTSMILASFDLAKMPTEYGKALRIVTHVFDRMGVRFRSPTQGPGARIARGELYPLTIYLIDYALHIPPDPLDLLASFQADTAASQDIYPPFRFILLTLITAGEILKNPRLMADHHELYRAIDKYLASIINTAHASTRDPGARSSSDRDRWPVSFYTLRETTNQWLTHAASKSRRTRHTLINRLDRSSLEYRQAHGIDLFLGGPLGIHAATGLPIITETPKGMTVVPFFSADPSVSSGELKQRAQAIHREYLAGPDWNKTTTDAPTGNPWPFLQQAADRRLDQEGARLVFEGGPVQCPLTAGLGELLPCPPRRRACQRLENINSLPQQECRMRQRIADLPDRDRTPWVNAALPSAKVAGGVAVAAVAAGAVAAVIRRRRQKAAKIREAAAAAAAAAAAQPAAADDAGELAAPPDDGTVQPAEQQDRRSVTDQAATEQTEPPAPPSVPPR